VIILRCMRECFCATFPLTARRATGIGLARRLDHGKWCLAHHQESFLLHHIGRDLRDHGRYDISFSIGDGLRPGSIADANDEANSRSLYTKAS